MHSIQIVQSFFEWICLNLNPVIDGYFKNALDIKLSYFKIFFYNIQNRSIHF